MSASMQAVWYSIGLIAVFVAAVLLAVKRVYDFALFAAGVGFLFVPLWWIALRST